MEKGPLVFVFLQILKGQLYSPINFLAFFFYPIQPKKLGFPLSLAEGKWESKRGGKETQALEDFGCEVLVRMHQHSAIWWNLISIFASGRRGCSYIFFLSSKIVKCLVICRKAKLILKDWVYEEYRASWLWLVALVSKHCCQLLFVCQIPIKTINVLPHHAWKWNPNQHSS